MPFCAVSSNASHAQQAIDEVCSLAIAQLGGAPELALAFYSSHYADEANDLARGLWGKLQPRALVGVLGESIISGSHEIEDRPALALWLASWQGTVAIEAFGLTLAETPDGPSLMGWPDALMEANPTQSLLLTFGDPYSFPTTELFLPTMNDLYPSLPVCGGMASNPGGPSNQALLLNGEVQASGAVAVLLRGAFSFRTVVSQGCRPIGQPMVITKGSDNVVQEIGGRRPMDYLRELLEQSSADDKSLIQRGLLVGLAMSEYRETFQRGDFLIRTLIGLDPRSGALAVTDRIRVGQTIQFHVRDAQTASEDWHAMLQTTASTFKPEAGLLFSCNGRGSRLFGTPNHDAGAIQQHLGPLPLAGFFAAGELGPVAGTSYIHGFTASSVFFG